MTPLNQLVTDLRALLQDELGTMQSGRLKAIDTEPSSYPLGEFKGLACIVQKFQEGSTTPITGGIHKDKVYVVKLIQYDKTKSVAEAASLIENSPDYVLVGPPRYVPQTSQSYEQVTFHIRNSHLILN